MNRVISGFVALSLCCIIAAHAGPTDAELHASYCVGALSAAMRTLEAGPKPDPGVPPGARRLLDARRPQLLAKLQHERDRYSGYLFSTGVLTGADRSADALGLTNALHEGEAEKRRCDNQAAICSASVFGSPGTPVPSNADPNRLAVCMDAEPACARVQRCMQGEGLPY